MPGKQEDFQVETHPLNDIKRTIAVLSGKGGVGKSMITALLATYLQRTGRYRVGILDADVTGPSIPKLFGAEDFKPKGSDEGLFPVRTHSNIQLMSINLLLDNPTSPVIWRGPILANTVKQFWSDVIWGDLDFLLLDMPPGTGDVPLTVFQSLPLDGIVIVTSPQDLVSLIVQKAIHMAQMMHIPIIGLVENMSHIVCPHCGKKISVFGDGKTAAVAQEAGIPYLGSLPIDPDLARLCDAGQIERIHKDYLEECLAALEKVPVHGQPTAPDAPAPQAAVQTDEGGSTVKKIAISAEGDQVSAHFGHCEGFFEFTIEAGKPEGKQFVANPGHKPGFLPNFLHDRGVRVIIAGGMGSGAVEIFQEKGIDVYTGAQGSVDEIARQYADGTLTSTGSVCHEHQHEGSCGDHS
ncbi:MAG: P-loop NTPase [Clostridiaceae bacterium]|jgi:Mrp family chromosome partitioning ATPase/predicted Fe-Mo cluster-binding NifX family protein|nr:P-loop NTPase [Clostridiales bacterium]MDD2440618.1 P-loop NTPase [Eubacteriales bacterium]MDD4139991.1 P-loop NTPase [Eubacteriales bacterium]MDD4744638.1 P-loop NTPase [Eubacteriales bacterium]NLB45276.1 P-loop NTPase [Clostridiaceae bacterium]